MHVSSVFVTEKSSRIFFSNSRNSPSCAWRMNHIPMKSNKIVNDPIVNNFDQSTIAILSIYRSPWIQNYRKDPPNFTLPRESHEIFEKKQRGNGEINSW